MSVDETDPFEVLASIVFTEPTPATFDGPQKYRGPSGFDLYTFAKYEAAAILKPYGGLWTPGDDRS